ncbi:discoidin domain-containing protein [Hafnia psychrotolerans]|uniref:F5/8 type C domain-containing protein n=1 Tax=Hafnia psychrotolerans TaxID=1477018 RepID=A0ABQ1GIQ0_9GAMM|nr:discoidin domain-containing protein [Hafnia psychrotolerans]GGA44571.1 hypothetical protein GCM10011328_19580 [Hafnia psychrotolerans]
MNSESNSSSLVINSKIYSLITTCRVTASSGCHRYPYWNEQFLFDGRSDTGWCTPSRTREQLEFINVDLGTTSPINKIRLLSRSINKNAGLPEKIIIRKYIDGLVLAVLEIGEQEISTWYEWETPDIYGPDLYIEFDQIKIRPEGKYFLQFMCLEFYTKNFKLEV